MPDLVTKINQENDLNLTTSDISGYFVGVYVISSFVIWACLVHLSWTRNFYKFHKSKNEKTKDQKEEVEVNSN